MMELSKERVWERGGIRLGGKGATKICGDRRIKGLSFCRNCGVALVGAYNKEN